MSYLTLCMFVVYGLGNVCGWFPRPRTHAMYFGMCMCILIVAGHV